MSIGIIRLKVDIPADLFVYDKGELEGQKKSMEKGSRLFCGKCGKLMGTMRERIEFPFNMHNLLAVMTDCKFAPMMGAHGSYVVHETCQQMIRSIPNYGFRFMYYERWILEVLEVKQADPTKWLIRKAFHTKDAD